jgi:hypothetical protein
VRGPDGPDLGNRDLELGEDFQEKRLEFLVRAVDLVDQQYRRLAVLPDGLQQRPADQERLGEDRGLLLP